MAFSPLLFSHLRTRPWVHGWLLFCLIFGALAPGLSHAVSNISTQDGQKIAICTASGMAYIRWQNTDTAPAAQPSAQTHQCLICSFGGDTPLGSQDHVSCAHQITDQPLHHTFASVNRSPCHWVTAAIRAPPAFFS
jgi:hypothetical protein